MGNTASSSGRNDQEKLQRKTAVKYLSEEETALEEGQQHQKQYNKNKRKSRKLIDPAAAEAAKRDVAEKSAAATAAQRLRQTSIWSLGSLSGRLNWSFTGGATKNSFHNRNKSNRKSFSSLQQQQRRLKTAWHKPLTNSIFSSHFKESSRNDQFHIEQLVAKGAFGVVFKVIDKRTIQQQENQQQQHQCQRYKIAAGKDRNNGDSIATSHSLPAEALQFYALKVLKKSKIIEENSVQQTKEEAELQKLCGHHPFIVQQIDLWQNRRNLHILSEYVPNGELFSKIAHFSIDLIRLYLAEIALAIDFLHNAGIIYRDAKPENILLTEDYHIKLTDFGLSKWLKLGATTKTMCGTFQYMAPEILRGEAYGHAVDWWSMGVIVCQMFTQQSPDIKPFLEFTLPPQLGSTVNNKNIVNIKTQSVFNNDQLNYLEPKNTASTALESQNFLPSEVKNLPHEAKDVLQRLLEIDPYKRIHSVLALQKIALYKNFKIEAAHLFNIRPLDIIINDEIIIYQDNLDPNESSKAAKAFHDF